MALFGKKDRGKSTKLFFVTDVHGSETTYRKFVNAGKFYGVDVLILGGDIAGKMVVPILDLGGGAYRATIQSITHELDGGEAVAEFEKRAGKLGTYTAVVTVDEYDGLAADPARSTRSTTTSPPNASRAGSSSRRSGSPAPASVATSPAATTTPPTSSSRSWPTTARTSSTARASAS